MDPDFILPRAWLVSALGNQGQWTEAEAQLRILYENREQANRWERLWIDQEMAKIEGNYAEAHQILGQLDELDPRNRNTKYLLGLQALR